jgi:L-serine deaminase
MVLLGGSTALQVYQGEQARKAQNQAADQAKASADQAFNKANPKKPDAAAMLYGNQQAAAGGVGSTMLTGPAGVDPATLSLGKSTLLGG